jgi:general secretion pathway protein A
MYTEFFELIEKPFSLSTSPRFLYLGDKHKEALAMLRYGVMERQGFVLLTGEVGTGKTTMVRALLSGLDTGVKYVHLANPLLSPTEFICYLTLSTFENRLLFRSKPEFLVAFEAFLIKCQQSNRHFVLIIDEAHKLSFDLLEEIRLLSNLETAEEKLISIFLVGQPELNERLSEPRCRPLLQRISIRYHIPPLSLRETKEYITTRLKKAGSRRAEEIFPNKTIDAIHQYSQGYPRMINILADNSLLLGYSKGESKISAKMIRSCYLDLQLGDSEEKGSAGKNGSVQESRPASRGLKSWWKWAALFLLISGSLGFVMARYGDRILPKFVTAFTEATKPRAEEVSAPMQVVERKPDERATAATPPSQPTPIVERKPDEQVAAATPPSSPKYQGPLVDEVKAVVEMKENMPSEPSAQGLGPSPVKADGRIVVVERGDSLWTLSSRVYGRSDEWVMELIRKKNPSIRDLDLIFPGQNVIFPPLPERQQ